MSQASALLERSPIAGRFVAAAPSLVMGERRAVDDLSNLSRRHDAVCATAVDPLQIAAVLEADGITDEVARRRYGCSDVFALAEALHRLVPLRVPATALPQRVPSARGRIVARGALFAAPSALVLAATQGMIASGSAVELLIVTIVGWGLSQLVAVLWHGVRADAGDRAAGAFGSAIVTGAVWIGLAGGWVGVGLAGWSWTRTSIALGLAVYIVAASVLIASDRDLWLAAALAPGLVAASILVAVGGRHDGTRAAVVIACAVALVVGAALWSNRTAAPGRFWPRRERLRTAVPHAVYGVCVGAFVAAPLLAGFRASGRVEQSLALAMVPLTLSMGVAEVLLHRLRAATSVELARQVDLAGFRAVASRSLIAAVSRFACALVLVSVAVVLIALAVSGPLSRDAAGTMGIYTVVGIGLFAGLVLVSWGYVGLVNVIVVGTLIVFGLAVAVADAPEVPFALSSIGLAAATGATALLMSRRLVTHR